MAKFESLGFCPNNSVVSGISLERNASLVGLWSLIGASVVCIDESDMLTVDCNAVVEMFTTDRIASDLMKAIIHYNVNADMIQIRQSHEGGCLNMQGFQVLQKKLFELQEAKSEPVLVLSNGSRYACILSHPNQDKSVIDVWFWDLQCCW